MKLSKQRVDRLCNSEGLLSKRKLERNSSLQEWQWVYLEQDAALFIEKIKKTYGKQKSKVKHTIKIWKSNN